MLTLNDELIRNISGVTDPQTLEAFRFEYIPNKGTIFRLEPIYKFNKLVELSLVGHRITDVTHIKSLTLLRVLNLSWNNISSLTPFCVLSHLEQLSLNHNVISTIPSEIVHLSKLKTLRLNSNPLSNKKDFFN